MEAREALLQRLRWQQHGAQPQAEALGVEHRRVVHAPFPCPGPPRAGRSGAPGAACVTGKYDVVPLQQPSPPPIPPTLLEKRRVPSGKLTDVRTHLVTAQSEGGHARHGNVTMCRARDAPGRLTNVWVRLVVLSIIVLFAPCPLPTLPLLFKSTKVDPFHDTDELDEH